MILPLPDPAGFKKTLYHRSTGQTAAPGSGFGHHNTNEVFTVNSLKKLFSQEGFSYLFFGVASTIVNWGVYTAAISFSRLSMAACNFLAWLCAILFAYTTNKLFVFHSRTPGFTALLKEFLLFIGARVFTGIFEVILPSLLFSMGLSASFLGIKGFFAKAVVSVLVIVLNYILSKLVIFRKKTNKSA